MLKRIISNISGSENLFSLNNRKLLYILSFIVIAGNIIDVINEPFLAFLSYINGANILFVIVLLVFCIMKVISSQKVFGLIIYSVIINVIISQLFDSTTNPEYAAYFLRFTVMIGMMIPILAIVNGKTHIFISALIFYVFYALILIKSRNQFLIDNILMIFITTSGYVYGVYYLISKVEKSREDQIDLNNKLEISNEELQTQKNYLEQINMILTEQKKQFEEQAKKLEQLIYNRDRFYTVISHDLKNPIGSLMGFTDLLKQRAEKIGDEKLNKYSDILKSISHNAYNLLINLLEWTRLQTDKIQINPEWYDPIGQVKQIIDLFQVSISNKKINIEIKQNDQKLIYADRNLVNTVIRNLLSNAIKFTPTEGKITLLIKQNDVSFIFAVTDTGFGISSEDIEKLFRQDLDFRKQGTDSESGTGLGLQLCKDLIELHHGMIRVESELNIGSTFSFTIPTQFIEDKTK